MFLPDCGVPENLEDRFKQYNYFFEEMYKEKVFAAVVSV